MYIDEVGTYACHMYGMFGIFFLNKIYSELASNEVLFFWCLEAVARESMWKDPDYFYGHPEIIVYLGCRVGPNSRSRRLGIPMSELPTPFVNLNEVGYQRTSILIYILIFKYYMCLLVHFRISFITKSKTWWPYICWNCLSSQVCISLLEAIMVRTKEEGIHSSTVEVVIIYCGGWGRQRS